MNRRSGRLPATPLQPRRCRGRHRVPGSTGSDAGRSQEERHERACQARVQCRWQSRCGGRSDLNVRGERRHGILEALDQTGRHIGASPLGAVRTWLGIGRLVAGHPIACGVICACVMCRVCSVTVVFCGVCCVMGVTSRAGVRFCHRRRKRAVERHSHKRPGHREDAKDRETALSKPFHVYDRAST